MTNELENQFVVINTNRGSIEVEVYLNQAPITAENFLHLVKTDFYDGLIFHRVIPGFMIQGGGFDKDMNQLETGRPIKNESSNGLKNLKGTLAMARTSDPDSATAQFFINTVDNPFLDYQEGRPGYSVFGVVTKGMEVVLDIEQSETSNQGPHSDVPIEKTVIHNIENLSV